MPAGLPADRVGACDKLSENGVFLSCVGSNKKGRTLEDSARYLLVAGAGFEPATFGL